MVAFLGLYHKLWALGLLLFALLFFFQIFPRFLDTRSIITLHLRLAKLISTIRHPLVPPYPYPYPYKFLFNPQAKCQKKNPFLVLLVIAESHDVSSRIAIRETWGNESNYEDVEVVTVFTLGLSPHRTSNVQQFLEVENEIYGDIVQQDFLDTYYNLTLKTLMGLEWVTKYCPNATYVMKVDKDMFLNVNYLFQRILVPGSPIRENYFTGVLQTNLIPLRDKDNKWYLPVEVYPNDTYPPYCGGSGYVLSVDMAKKIYDVAQVTKVISIEDAFMGICLHKLNISIIRSPDYIFNGFRVDYNRCLFNRIITAHDYGTAELREVWKDFWSLKKTGCPE